MPSRGYIEELEFDLPTKLLEELVKLFDEMTEGPLDTSTISSSVKEEQGVYQLFKDGELVYIGKTDSDAGLKRRLLRHSKKIQSRNNLDVEQVGFKAIRVYVFTAMDLEGLLIKHYREKGIRPGWQHSGFGSNDPGRERDSTEVKDDSFDALYPINLDEVVILESDSNTMKVADLLTQMKNQLHYNIRFQTEPPRSRNPHPELKEKEVTVDSLEGTTFQYLQRAKRALGDSWRIMTLPGYVIIYKNDRRKIPSGTIVEAD
ncbi:GIY-YIG nuclease family protein [Billgrantia ethanolica]|uniref:GIY-YIG nuclease family protein n=1 Tax=Billgrantia ethanolica TaxID=2733486 RepID=A0ABS9A9R7_9GAMM|nr:GIY-YIG nuclease family protein [Halomonas ethanolica]MCE8005287.1 GIY-YIG nuclease family protein [Halomonas ethanolica]